MPFGELKPKRGRPATGGPGSADRTHAIVNEHSQVPWRERADQARVSRLEADPEAWLKHYLAFAYTRPFEKPHREIIAGAMDAHATSGRFVVAAERGIGKSAVLWGLILYLALSGKQPYPVCVPWADKPLKRAFRFWKNALAFNEVLAADYPEHCDPFAHAKGMAQRVASRTWKDGPYDGQTCGAQLTVGEGMIVLPDRLGCIGGSTINGNIRGLNHPQDDGTILRPTIALLDDVQDRGTAKSEAQVKDTVAIIDGDVGGCGDPGRDLPMLMACNCICPGDVSEHYLNNPEWRALRVPCVERWPDGWDDLKSKRRSMWEELHEKFLAGGKGAPTFYRRHKKALTRGMKLSAPAAFKGADKCPDAFYGVMRMYFRMGHESFMAERQQQPVDPVAESGPYTLTPAVILSRIAKRKPHDRPDWAAKIIASTDINPSYAFSSAMVGFGLDLTAAALWYGIHKLDIASDLPDVQFNQKLFDALAAHGRELAGMPNRPELWAIDAGGKQFDTVVRFVAESVRLCGLQALAFTGRGAKNYRIYGRTVVKGQIREQCHGCFDIKSGRRIQWVAWNADYWKEVAQRAWLGEVGSPGTISLPVGSHAEFAGQICGDKLLGKGEIGGQMIWNWTRVPGRNDFGDAMAQAYAAAAFSGIGTGGYKPQQRKVYKRRIQHVNI